LESAYRLSPAMNSCATCRLNAMLWERCPGHGFHPLKAQLTLSNH
jgi:hypothetical protein